MLINRTRFFGHHSPSLKPRPARSRANRSVFYEQLEARQLLAANVLSISPDGIWHGIDPDVIATSVGQNLIRAESFGLFDVQEQALIQSLTNTPLEFTPGNEVEAVELNVPRPDGSFERFAIVESPVMHPELAAQLPGTATYRGQGIDQPAATIRLDYTMHGFHAQVLSPDGRYYVDPYFHLQTDLYMSYYAHDLDVNPTNADVAEFLYSDTGDLLYQRSALGVDHTHESGDEHDHQHDQLDEDDHHHAKASRAQEDKSDDKAGTGSSESAPGFGDQLRTYRLAVAATGEYTSFWGGTQAAGQSAIVTAVNRLTGIYENDVAVRMQLVPNNSSIVYTNSGSDPYTNNNGVAMLSENQANIDAVIGNANYDVGHVFSTGGGGVAWLAVIGQTGAKARGVTGLPSPTGDAFYVDYVAHEMGHQYGGNHTFNGDSGNCSGSNRNGSTAYEPGSGSTIQGYAGICGNDNLQNNSDAMFHSISIDEIRTEVTTGTGGAAAAVSNTGNAIPVVGAGGNFIIPDQTPFELTATGSDADGNASLTYSWEQRDLGPQRDVNASDNGSSPIFRTWSPTSDPTRVFPRMANVLNGTTVTGEQYPTTNWNTMDFRVVLRDNSTSGGGVASADMTVRVVDSGTGFDVTSQSTATSWTGLTNETLTWNVSGTNSGLINTPNVDILFSLDGFNYDIVLATGVPNNGSHVIQVPNVDTSTGRIKVKGSGNVFFDVNRANITVASAIPPDIIGIYANGSMWQPLFVDMIDGLNDNSELGYELTGRIDQTEKLPWIKVDRVIIEFDQPIDFATVDPTGLDFSLGGTAGFGPAGLASIPNIIGATPGPQTFPDGTISNTIVLTLDGPLEAANLDLQIIGSDIFSTGGAAFPDSIYEFNALPGDVDDNRFTNPNDAQAVVNAGTFAFLTTSGPFGNYDFRLDVNADNFVNVTDAQEVVNRFNSFLPSNRPSSPLPGSNGYDLIRSPRISSDDMSAVDVDEPGSKSDKLQQLAGAIRSEQDAVRDRDNVFETLPDHESTADVDDVHAAVADLTLDLDAFDRRLQQM